MDYKTSYISEEINKIASFYGKVPRETILFENYGKHMLEIDLMMENLENHGRLLDVGGGVGINLICLRNLLGENIELYVIDRFEEYTEDNRMGSNTFGIRVLKESNIYVVVQDFLENPILPFNDEFFDVITCFDVVEHLPCHPLKLLKEIKRVIKINGIFILGGPNSISINKRIKLLLGKHPYMEFDLWCMEKYFNHYREYSPDEYKLLLEKSGFNNIKIILSKEPITTKARNKYHRGKHSKISFTTIGLHLTYFLIKFLPGLRPTVYCVAKKN